MRLWREWLPDNVAQQASQQEPQRFSAIVQRLSEDWDRDNDPADTLKWLSLINSYVQAKGDYRTEDLDKAANTMLKILLSCQQNSAAQARWASSLTRVLRTWRHKLSITIDWRRLYDFLQESVRSMLTSYEGPLILETKRSAMFNLIHRCRRFFSAGSAAEIWNELKPELQNLHTPAAQQALGWLALFLPTHGLLRGEPGWGATVGEWMTLWESDAHNNFWRGHWMLLFGQVAKHDIQGTIDWRPLLPRLFNQLQWAFQVPVGTASASPPFSSANSPVALSLFHNEVHTLATTAGKIITYTLATTASEPHSDGILTRAKSGDGKAPSVDESEHEVDDAVLSQLEQLVDLLEQYFHPSNNGRWNKYLAKFVTSLCKHLNKRLAKEANAEEEEAAGEDKMQAVLNGYAVAEQGRQKLSTDLLRRLARVILRMADKAQYSKDNNLAVAACSALSQMSYIVPDLVLPLVSSRFEVALESMQASHQLVSAIHTLGLCVRPLLLAGFAAHPDSAESGPIDAHEHREAGGEAVAAAMMATLPGIDANDPPKTLACFRFYCMVISTVGVLKGGDEALPLYTQEWVEELLSRVFGILNNLEAPQTRSDHSAVQGNASAAASDQASFLLEGNSMFRPMMELLFARLPEDLQLQAIKQTARFVTTSTLASVTNEAALICNAAAWAAPDTCRDLLLKPLLTRIEEEVRHDGTAGAGRMSKVQETTLDWLIGAAAATALHLGPALLPLQGQIKRVLTALFAAPSKAVQAAASKLLAPLLGSLTSYYPLNQFEPLPVWHSPPGGSGLGSGSGPPGGVGVEPWISSKPPESQIRQFKPRWHQPTSEETAFAEALVNSFLTGAAQQLLELSQGKGSGQAGEAPGAGKYPKELLQGLLLQMEGSFMGLQGTLPDFASLQPPHDAASGLGANPKLALVGCGAPPITGPATRELAAKALVAAAGFVGPNDTETLKIMLRGMSVVVSRGAQEYQDAINSFSAWKADQDIAHDSAVAALLFGQYTEGGGKWGKRRPRWLMVERTYLHGLWRTSQAAHKAHATADNPAVPLEQIPTMHKAVFQQLVRFSMHSYKAVRDFAVMSMEGCMKQYPAYALQVLPLPLAALANLPIPEIDLEHASVELPAEVLGKLRGAMREAVGGSSIPLETPKGNPAAEAAKEVEGLVQGAAAMLRAQSLFRAVSRQPSALAGLVAGLMAASQHSSPQAQPAIMECFVLFALRFLRPPQMAAAQVSEGQYPKPIQDMMTDLLRMGGPDQAHWRYSQRADVVLLFMLPPANPQAATLLTQHYLTRVQSQLPGQRSLGLTGLLALLRRDESDDEGPIRRAVRQAVQQEVQGQPGFGPALLEQMSHAHPSPGSAQEGSGQSQMQKMMSMSKDDMVVSSLSSGFDRFREWPFCVGAPEGLRDQAFMPRHARLALALTDAAPEAALNALQGPVQTALQQAQDEDRPRTSAATEILAGLIGSAASFQSLSGGKSAWEGWLKGTFQTALAGTPLDMAEGWAVAVRFAVNSLAHTSPAGMNAVLDVIIQAPGPGSPSSAVVKRLKYVGQCLEELSAMGIVGTDDTNPASSFSSIDSSSGDMHRRHGQALKGRRPKVPSEAVQAGRRFQKQFLQELPGLMIRPGEALRLHNSWCAAILCDSLMWQAPCGPHAAPTQSPAAAREADAARLLKSDVDAYCQKMVQGMKAGAAAVAADSSKISKQSSSSGQHPVGPSPMDSDEAIFSAVGASASAQLDSEPQPVANQQSATDPVPNGDTVMEEAHRALQSEPQAMDTDTHTPQADSSLPAGPSGANPPPTADTSGGNDEAIAQLGFAVQFIVQGLRNGAGPTLMPLLVQLLPYLLKTQELQTPELQPLSLESKAALALLKYLPLTSQAVPQVIETLRECSKGEPWAARAACLVFTQYFWFRHCFLLTPQQGQALQQLVVDMLSDNKLEVQELAAKTLSGILKGSTPAQFDQLRQHFLEQVSTLFPAKRRSKRPALPSKDGATKSQKHAAVLGLKAFVLTSPYDVPFWLPEVLMALVRAAGQPAPIKTTVRHTLGEFKRTHEEAGLAETRRLLSPEQWEAIQDVSSPASYFV